VKNRVEILIKQISLAGASASIADEESKFMTGGLLLDLVIDFRCLNILLLL